MTASNDLLNKDFRQRFLFDDLDLRGCIVSLSETIEAIQATHHYPPNLAVLLNQFALAATLLRDSIKIDGSLTIQLRTPGAIKLLIADCLSDRRVRAIAEYDQEMLPVSGDIALDQLGQGAVLAITITPDEGERYQSIVPIENATLAECLSDYFRRSEQLPSGFKLLASSSRGVGIALHALPANKVTDKEQSDEHFARINMFLHTLREDEAFELDANDLLTRLFNQESCRVFAVNEVEFGCICSAEKSLDAIKSLGQNDMQGLINEQRAEGNESLVVDCHFCFQRYEFSFSELSGVFS